MKIKSVKRIIFIALAVVMCFGSFVFAADDIKTQAQTALKETMSAIESLLKKNGAEYGSEWMVMDLMAVGTE